MKLCLNMYQTFFFTTSGVVYLIAHTLFRSHPSIIPSAIPTYPLEGLWRRGGGCRNGAQLTLRGGVHSGQSITGLTHAERERTCKLHIKRSGRQVQTVLLHAAHESLQATEEVLIELLVSWSGRSSRRLVTRWMLNLFLKIYLGRSTITQSPE